MGFPDLERLGRTASPSTAVTAAGSVRVSHRLASSEPARTERTAGISTATTSALLTNPPTGLSIEALRSCLRLDIVFGDSAPPLFRNVAYRIASTLGQQWTDERPFV